MKVDAIRRYFPYLARRYNGRSLAYLDNASTTQKPQVVIDALVDAYTNHYANIHRGVYDLSVEATELYENVRAQVRDLISAKSEEEIIFTKNTTESINLIAYTLTQSLKDGDEILLSEMEHHSNIVPWQMLAERAKTRNTKPDGAKASTGKQETRNTKIKYIPIDSEGRLDLSTIDKLVTGKTKIVSLTLMSNVLGTINDVNRISSIVHRLAPKAIVLIDAAQAVGHMKIDVQNLGCDFLVFSAHKMYGPAGVGVMWGRREILEELPPFMGGGDMILSVDFQKTTFNKLPWKFEAGTPAIADVIATGAAIDFVLECRLSLINKHELQLTKYVLSRLSSDPNIKLYGPADLADRGPVVAFNVDGIHPHDVASILSEEGVAIRSGHHCAQPLMKVLGVDAVCRVSFGIYNTREEVDRLMKGIEKVKKIFRLTSNAKRLKQFKGVSHSALSVSQP